MDFSLEIIGHARQSISNQSKIEDRYDRGNGSSQSTCELEALRAMSRLAFQGKLRIMKTVALQRDGADDNLRVSAGITSVSMELVDNT